MPDYTTKVLGGVLLMLGLVGSWTVPGGYAQPVIILHLLAGAALLIVAGPFGFRRSLLLITGIAYGLTAFFSFLKEPRPLMTLGLDPGDPWLCLALAAACVYLGNRYPEKEAPSLERL